MTQLPVHQLGTGESSLAILGALLLGAVVVASTVWTYRDTKRNDHETVLWTAIVFTLPLVGLGVYLLAGRGQLD